MSDAGLLADHDQLAEDAKVLDAWASCGDSAGGKMGLIRRAAAALREVAELRANGLVSIRPTVTPEGGKILIAA